ncbi:MULTISPECIES: HipA N-terminal domain-containing protein [unclassified Corynebacterium]|uniref:HipA N-terminal domain-containing protein n=1 Tax=unclassified Corynebacterium TaxID=2624378 RepID=UPI001D0DC9F3|nr:MULTISPECIES: HipA N-terminal domain-containing protein [unclassified Corynebacterium]
MSVDLDLYLAGVHAGTIRHRADDGAMAPELTYTRQWLAAKDAFPLSLSMPLQDRPHNVKKTTRYLEALLPENTGTLED